MKKVLPYIILHTIVFIYSLGSICSKAAASKDFLSFDWILLYGLVLLSLAVYAILWQQVLKKVPLNTAYANKSVTVIWGMIWGVTVFRETLTPANIIGAVLILAGIILMVTGGKSSDGAVSENGEGTDNE
ncbi:MAG: EamA family transporter [Ruminiclostridium sp.]|nr:EamA family transporter [Ruminiclostridium sp.]